VKIHDGIEVFETGQADRGAHHVTPSNIAMLRPNSVHDVDQHGRCVCAILGLCIWSLSFVDQPRAENIT
jgi:hypothetical protein